VKIKIAAALILSVAAIILGIAIGSTNISPITVLISFGHNLFNLNLPEDVSATQVSIIWSLRLPRTLLAFCAGAALSVSGAVMQSVLRNPLASSYTLGVSSGASLGAALVFFVGVSFPIIPMFTLPILGFSFGLATILVVIAITRKLDARLENHTIILTGMVFALFINSITTLMFAFFREGTQRMVLWTMGIFSQQNWQTVYILVPITIAFVIFINRYKWELDVMTFGEEQAQTVGVNIKRVKFILLISAAALTGSTIAFVGIVGFVDLVAPHVVRKIFGAAHRFVIPMSALVGGIFMVVADIASRTLTPPVELPVGAVTAIIGAPFFAYIYFGKRKRG